MGYQCRVPIINRYTHLVVIQDPPSWSCWDGTLLFSDDATWEILSLILSDSLLNSTGLTRIFRQDPLRSISWNTASLPESMANHCPSNLTACRHPLLPTLPGSPAEGLPSTAEGNDISQPELSRHGTLRTCEGDTNTTADELDSILETRRAEEMINSLVIWSNNSCLFERSRCCSRAERAPIDPPRMANKSWNSCCCYCYCCLSVPYTADAADAAAACCMLLHAAAAAAAAAVAAAIDATCAAAAMLLEAAYSAYTQRLYTIRLFVKFPCTLSSVFPSLQCFAFRARPPLLQQLLLCCEPSASAAMPSFHHHRGCCACDRCHRHEMQFITIVKECESAGKQLNGRRCVGGRWWCSVVLAGCKVGGAAACC